MRYNILIIIIMFMAVEITAQTLSGKLVDEQGEPLIGATVRWKDHDNGTYTDQNGAFELPSLDHFHELIISYVGYETLTVLVNPGDEFMELKLHEGASFEVVEVRARLADNRVSTLANQNIEHISSCELKKAACCNLSESFDTNASINVGSSNSLIGIKEMEMLGLRGLYTQLQIENRPNYQDLSYPWALEFIPGPWIDGIQIAKGASTVLSGTEGLTGKINTELVKPFNSPTLFVNLFAATTGRMEANVHLNTRLNENWSTGILMHSNRMQNEIDKTGNGFLDMPLKEHYSFMYRLFYESEDVFGQFNVFMVDDQIQGGQLGNQSENPYRIDSELTRWEIFGKLGYAGFTNPSQSLGFIWSYTHYDNENQFGERHHSGIQNSTYANLLFKTDLGNASHEFFSGVSYSYDDIDEVMNGEDYSRINRKAGIFTEYSFNPAATGHNLYSSILQNFGLMAGLRLDHHNQYDWLLTPTMSAKYNIDEFTVLRVNAGRSFRTPHVITDNLALMTSNRAFIIEEEPEIEEGWNFGFNFAKEFKIGSKDASLFFDAYHSFFENQIVADRDIDVQEIRVYNLDGKSYANSLLLAGQIAWNENLASKAGVKFNDVHTTMNGQLDRAPMIPRWNFLKAVDWESDNGNWMFNLTWHWVKPGRLPHLRGVPQEVLNDFSGDPKPFSTINFQLTKRFSWIEFYAGVENLTDKTMDNPILASDDPYGPFFDASLAYMPTIGRRAFIGLRYDLQ
nr:TonB-dependent receptor [Saprospiraceae bacterium]